MHSMEDDLFFGAIPQTPEDEPSPIQYAKPADTSHIPPGTFIFDYSGGQPQFHPLLDAQINTGGASASKQPSSKKGWVNFEDETSRAGVTGWSTKVGSDPAKGSKSDRKSKKSHKKSGAPSGISATNTSGNWPGSTTNTSVNWPGSGLAGPRPSYDEAGSSGKRSRHGSGYDDDPNNPSGRRSAPVFSRRLSFSSTEYAVPGQPNYNRSSSIRKSFSRKDSEAGRRPRVDTKGFIRERSLSESGDTSRKNSILEESTGDASMGGRRRSITKGISKKRSNSRRDSYGSPDERQPGEYYSETEAQMASRYAYGGDDWRTESDDAKMNRLFREASHPRPRSDSSRKFSVWSSRDATPLSDLAETRRPSTGELVQTNFANQQGQTFTVTDGKQWPPKQPSRGVVGDDGSTTDDDEKLELVSSNKKTQVYKRRFYMLFVFCLVSFVWNAVYATWGPISQSAKAVYGWSDSDIAEFTWLGSAPFLITSFPMAYLMDEKGLRPAMLLSCALMALGTGVRCIPGDTEAKTWLIRLGQLINGIGGAVPMSGPTLLSGLWFPANQRTTATAMATVLGYLGMCAAVVLEPLVIPEPELAPINGSSSEADLLLYYDASDSGVSSNATDYSLQKSRIELMLYTDFAAAGLLCILTLIYFPSKPPKPPSLSAAAPREQYLTGILKIIRNKQFWLTAIAYSLPTGIYEVWQIVLDLILGPKGVSQVTVGWMDFYAIVAGCISGLLVSRFADYFTRQLKVFLLVFYFLAAGTMLWFCCMLQGYLPFNQGMVYASLILGGILLDGGAPLFFELVIEVSYPVGEGVASGCLMFVCGSIGIIFLALLEIRNIGNDWVNWLFASCIGLAIPLLLFIKTDFGRADVDDGEDYDESDLESSSSEDNNQIRKI